MRRLTILLLGAASAFALVAGAVVWSVEVPSLERASLVSTLVLGNDGEILRPYLAADGRWRLPVRPEDVSQDYLNTLLAYEDRRFFRHSGIDLLALARVGWSALRQGRAVSGASTITMQVVRLLNPEPSSGLKGKLFQMLRAIKFERILSKQEILTLYLTLAPFGGNIEGIRAASLLYFDKEPKYLSLEEGALLVAIAQSPTRRRPDRYPTAAAEGRDRVLARLANSCEASRACSYPTPIVSLVGSRPLHAPHLADRMRKRFPGRETIATTIDMKLQSRLEEIIRESLQTWPADVNAAALVVRNSDCAVQAYIGSGDFFGRDTAGQFDHVRAVRSPGSALKPMIYALGFEALIIHPDTIIADRPVNFEGYAPQNFNEDYQGEMTIREALIKSINTTAVRVLARVTPKVLLTRLRSAGISVQVDDTDSSAGLAVALGGGGVSLEDLTRLFAGMSNRGRACSLKMLVDESVPEPRKILDEDVAWAVTDVLGDMPPPPGFGPRQSLDGGRRIAYKTGTSFGYRDAWAIGFDRAHTVGVWIGRSDATPNPGAMGVTAAAPILYRTFDLLPVPERDVAGPSTPHNLFATHAVPPRLYRFSDIAGPRQDHPLRILFPRKGSVIIMERDGDDAPFVPLVADGGDPPYFWFVDGLLLPSSDAKVRWRPEGVGPVAATLMDSRGLKSEVDFLVK